MVDFCRFLGRRQHVRVCFHVAASRRAGPNLASQVAKSLNSNLIGSGASSGTSSSAAPPVIKTEDVDAPTVMVRPATPTIMVCPGSRRGSTASLSRRGSS